MGRVDPKAGTLPKLLSACNCQLAVTPALGATPAPSAAPSPAPGAAAAAQLCLRPADVNAFTAANAAKDGPAGEDETTSPAYDIALAPPGTRGWDDLRRSAAEVWVGSGKLLVASLDDLIRIRRSRLTEADQARLPELEALTTAIEQTERREAGGNPRFPAHWDVRPLAHLDWLLLRGRVRDVERGRRQRTLTGFCS